MPRGTIAESLTIRKAVQAALRDGANSPRKVQIWLEQNTDTSVPSIPTIASILREEGWEPIGYVWAKKGKGS